MINKKLALATAAAVIGSVAAAGAANAQAREQIRIVGSSTVFPFASAVVENFGRTTQFPTPVIESTGSGGGIRLFCAGVGVEHPDITNASRRIKASEVETCEANGVAEVTEVKIGFDGIVVANSEGAEQTDYTLEHLFLGLAKTVPVDGELVENPYTNWSEIDSSLPDKEIEVLGPPPTSGTRDAFEELCMEAATEDMEGYGGEEYTEVRQDGVWVDSGENDNLIVQNLTKDKDAFGIFGYGFLEENRDKLEGAMIGGIEPTPETISSGEYPVSRSLFFYIKKAHLEKIPGKYAAEITLFEWLDFLLGRVGVRETLKVVDYYERIGWLGEAAAEELRDHARAFEDPGVNNPRELDMADHVLSLVYIARLSAMAR